MSKTSTAKKTVSRSPIKSSDKKILTRRFNLKSKKVQFVVVILIVAILGGGYFTVKSFASNTISIAMNSNQAWPYTPASGCATNVNTQTQDKNSIPVRVLLCSGKNSSPPNTDVGTGIKLGPNAGNDTYVSPLGKGVYQVCAFMKGAGDLTMNVSGYTGPNQFSNGSPGSIDISSAEYKNICGGQFKSADGLMFVNIYLRDTRAGIVNISNITVTKIGEYNLNPGPYK